MDSYNQRQCTWRIGSFQFFVGLQYFSIFLRKVEFIHCPQKSIGIHKTRIWLKSSNLLQWHRPGWSQFQNATSAKNHAVIGILKWFALGKVMWKGVKPYPVYLQATLKLFSPAKSDTLKNHVRLKVFTASRSDVFHLQREI